MKIKWIAKKASHLCKGEQAEKRACIYLQQQGLKLIEKNYRCKRGEIDLVMRQHDSLVFVEVRFRKNNLFGGALASVTPGKQKKLRLTAMHYLQQYSCRDFARFDVLAITGEDNQAHIEWIQNAF